MTTLQTHVGGPAAGTLDHPAEGPGVHELVGRLRDAAGRAAAFSETKLLLREAAAMVERLDRDGARNVTEMTRLTAELSRAARGARTP
jgi:hypothetical protein